MSDRRGVIAALGRMQLERVLGTLILVLIFAVMVGAVVLRYGFGIGMTWYEEFGRYGLILIAILAIGAGIKNKSHIRIETDFLPEKVQKSLTVINWTLSFAFLAAFSYLSFGLASAVRASRSPAMQLPMSWVYITIGVVALLGLVRLIERAIAPKDS